MKNNFGTLAIIALTMMASSALPVFANSFQQNHPRRAQVLKRDNYEQRRLNRNLGNLGGHYNQLSREDRNIRRQEQRDARQNNGHITRGEQARLNREETHLNNQINRDRRQR